MASIPRNILIVDDVPAHRILLRARLGAACYGTDVADSGAAAMAAVQARMPDLILLDHALPDMTGLDLCRRLKADPVTAAVPLVVFSPDRAASLDALQAGADDALLRPVDERLLAARIRNLLRARDRLAWPSGGQDEFERLGFAEPVAEFAAPQRIGLVTGGRELALRWKTALAPHSTATPTFMRREEALNPATPAPDLYLIAADLGAGVEGMQLMSDLRSRPASRDSAICLVLPERADERAATALDLGADDVLRDGFNGAEAALRARRLIAHKRRNDQQRDRLAAGLRMAVTDPLTGLHNRRYALPALARMVAERRLAPGAGALLLLDLDHFKRVNDSYGHPAGDAVLVETAARLRAQLGPGDLVARLGGEEFLIALPGIPPSAACQLAERLRAALSGAPISLPGIPGGFHITASIGLVFASTPDEAAEALIARADRAMLGAKCGGRNRIGLADRPAHAG